MVFSFVSRRVQPLQLQKHPAFRYEGTQDPTRMSPKPMAQSEVVKYFATPSDYLSTRHRLWSKPGGILYTFISEGRMLSMLQGLDLTTHKRKDHMIASNSFILGCCNGIKKAFYLAATRSSTRPACLDLEGARSSIWKWRFKVPDMKPETFPMDSFTRWLIR